MEMSNGGKKKKVLDAINLLITFIGRCTLCTRIDSTMNIDDFIVFYWTLSRSKFVLI